MSARTPEVPVLSVIIVAYKSADEIPACLRSLPPTLGERRVEVIVANNSPGDGLEAAVHACRPGTVYLPFPENLGFGRANNRGYERSTGENILFLNPDTVCNEAALGHCLRRLVEDRSIGLISPKLVMRDGKIDAACRRSIPTLWDGFCRAAGLSRRFPGIKAFGGYNLSYLPEDGSYDVGAINGAFMMGRRSVFEEIGVFDEAFFMYGDDLDLCIRVAKAGYRIVYDGSMQIVHIKGMSVAKDLEGMSTAIFDANRDVYLKHFNPTRSRWVAWKYRVAFGLWKKVARLRAARAGHRRVQPL